jgi:hypothetical protein
MSRASSAAPRLCYLCGEVLAGPATKDHVPPRLFYPKLFRETENPNLLTLPTHRACNEEYRLDEEYLVATLLPIVAFTDAGHELLSERAAQFHRGKTQPLMRKVLGEFELRPSGMILPPGQVVKRFEAGRVDRVLWKITRGLFFAHHSEVLPESTPRNILSVRGNENLPGIAAALENAESLGVMPNVFDYRFARIDEVEGMYLWALRLWEYFTIFVGHHAPENYGERRKTEDSAD